MLGRSRVERSSRAGMPLAKEKCGPELGQCADAPLLRKQLGSQGEIRIRAYGQVAAIILEAGLFDFNLVRAGGELELGGGIAHEGAIDKNFTPFADGRNADRASRGG